MADLTVGGSSPEPPARGLVLQVLEGTTTSSLQASIPDDQQKVIWRQQIGAPGRGSRSEAELFPSLQALCLRSAVSSWGQDLMEGEVPAGRNRIRLRLAVTRGGSPASSYPHPAASVDPPEEPKLVQSLHKHNPIDPPPGSLSKAVLRLVLWLAFVDRDPYVFLSNPITGSRVDLPSIIFKPAGHHIFRPAFRIASRKGKPQFYTQKVVLSANPNSGSRWTAMAIIGASSQMRHIMFLVLKALNLLCESKNKSYTECTGIVHGWDVLFYPFSFLPRNNCSYSDLPGLR